MRAATIQMRAIIIPHDRLLIRLSSGEVIDRHRSTATTTRE